MTKPAPTIKSRPELSPGWYLHFKGNAYYVLGVAVTEEGLPIVVYVSEDGGLYSRSVANFCDSVVVAGLATRRFVPYDPSSDPPTAEERQGALAKLQSQLETERLAAREGKGLQEQLAAQKTAVEKYLAATGHDLCHENRHELAKAFGLEDRLPEPPRSATEMRDGCGEYICRIYGTDPVKELLAEVARYKQAEARRQPLIDEILTRIQEMQQEGSLG